ncbi:Phosphotransferase enzyme family, putative [Verrucomicrobiia bacterium DG1235]|nr:Phosphotransferase enzyme family, putative [Verrucomicrobiae bacterium DG1235]
MQTAQLQDFSRPILDAACQQWGLSSPARVSEAENLLFACQSPNGKVALRMTHPLHRDASQLTAELDWIARLAQKKIPVVNPLPSKNDNWVETISLANKSWHACVFRWIEGAPIKNENQTVTENSIQLWGGLTSQIIAASLEMNRLGDRLPRHHWNSPIPGQPTLDKQLRPEHPFLADDIAAAQASLEQLPRTPDTYLLAHTDLHAGNVFQTKTGSLIALDFDDCCYHYLLQEFSMPIYYSLLFTEKDLKTEAKRFLQSFLVGYRKYHDIDPDSLELLPLFFKLRDLDLRAISFLWNIPRDSKWYRRIEYVYENGNPLSELPWAKWAK